MKLTKYVLFYTVILFLIQSCSNNTKVAEKKGIHLKSVPCRKSWEMFGGSKDTINVTDCHNLKQGRWIITRFVVLNKKNGPEMIWSQEGNYSNGKRNGFWKNYDDKGNVKDSVYYKNDTIVDL